MSKRQTRKEIFLVLCSFIVGGLMMLVFVTAVYNKPQNNQTQPVRRRESKVVENTTITESLEKIMDATVVVQGYRNSFQESTGSGFIYKTDEDYGYILTNEHILKEKDAAKVILLTEETVDAEILGKDQYLDLAVLRIPKKYVTVTAILGSSEETHIGDTVFTIGTPMGVEYKGTVTSGIISGKDRMVNLAEESTGSWQMKAIQIDAAINPGSSGGPLCNIYGEVIGITTMKLIDTQIEGMGFAIPIEYAKSHLEALETKQEIKWPVLGIEMVNVSNTSSLVKNDITIPNRRDGVAVTEVKENTPASNKLKKGDIIIKIDEKEIKKIAELKYAIYQHESGDKITITFLRDEKEKTETITLK